MKSSITRYRQKQLYCGCVCVCGGGLGHNNSEGTSTVGNYLTKSRTCFGG